MAKKDLSAASAKMAEKAGEKSTGADTRSAAAAAAVEQIKERFGDGSIMKLGEAKRMEVEAIPTGCLSLDIALGVGGVPRGRIIEIFGPEASGKTTLAQHIVSEVQKTGGIAAFVDAEHALDPDYAKKIGVNVKELLISQPDTGEQALEITETLVRSNGVDVIVVGVTGRQQFAECLAAFHSPTSFDGEGFACDDPRFVNPALWRLV